ncbi:vacuolar ATPase assembly VMA22 [Fusarium subglutinans]|uniref:Vacuolar ATPase assembly protein VMA22 n=1 Tax=Gibberella subglutinans TaxID=42677 RepID=A0A8H5PDJ9_GIBSU|nr:vacuolar ATPase assembly VMA22 [Fusarium subglutinans]KAF5594835.1 vacuolar ATPase assembly VMA22 [Fusarium subglutinans]
MEEQQHIDELLERYLSLLDEYSQLRKSLSRVQSDVFHNIARANFAGERGMRYGQDHYDERMQATRLLAIEQDAGQSPTFSIFPAPEEGNEADKEENSSAEKSDEASTIGAKEASSTEKKRKQNKNPLQWFGLLAPMPLRMAQTHSVTAVEEVIPRLVSVNAEMLNLEIEVRRARKRRAKAEAAEAKTSQTAAATLPQSTAV